MSFGVPRPRTVAAGQQISARNTNQYRRAVLSLQQARNFLFINRPRPWYEAFIHVIDVIQGDYLECRRVWRAGTLGVHTVYVARPERLRTSETVRNGVTYTYTDNQTRTATKGADSETQRVTTDYLVGDFIEVNVIRGKTGITIVDEQPAVLVDANRDGRAWAADPPPP